MISYLDPATEPQASADALRRQGREVRVVPPATGKRDVLAAFARALDFPAYFGGNLDALAECLADLSWLPRPLAIVWAGYDAVRRDDPRLAQTILRILDASVDDRVAVIACRR